MNLERFLVAPGTAWGTIAIGLVLDVITCGLELRWNYRGHGSSGVGVIPFMLYIYAALLARTPVPFVLGPAGPNRVINLAALGALHALLQYLIPRWHFRLLHGKMEPWEWAAEVRARQSQPSRSHHN